MTVPVKTADINKEILQPTLKFRLTAMEVAKKNIAGSKTSIDLEISQLKVWGYYCQNMFNFCTFIPCQIIRRIDQNDLLKIC